jgi:hypothetical protein
VNWDALGAIAEITPSIGVILSLIYLGIQIRSQNIESKISSTNELVSQYLDTNRDLSRDRELAKLILDGFRDFDALRGAERLQFSAYMTGICRSSEALFQQRLAGRLDESIWSGHFQSLKGLFLYPGIRAWWSTREHWFSEEYRSLLLPLMTRDEPPKSYGKHA